MSCPNFDRIDWNNLSEEELLEIEAALKSELTVREQRDADMRAWGKILFFRARKLNWKYNQEILTVLNEWVDDPDMMERHKIKDERVYDWAAKKREQRKYDRAAQAGVLREYWRKVKAKREFYRGLAVISRNKGANTESSGVEGLQDDFLADIVEPFSPESQMKDLIGLEFLKLLDIHEVHRIPWDQVLLSEVRHKEQTTLKCLALYTDYGRLEVVVKFQALLGLEYRGHIEIVQDEPFADLKISPVIDSEKAASVTVKHREGQIEAVDMDDIDQPERLELIEKAKNGELICV